MIAPFSFSGFPRLTFGAGRISCLPDLIKPFGSRVLLVIGNRSFKRRELAGENTFQYPVSGEPSPETVDKAVREFHEKEIDLVVAAGGGSVIDAGKAISAMLPSGEPVADFVEGVGDKKHDGRKIPFIAVPTTAGTGSEATKNSVLSRVGEGGFKRSLRHDAFMPDAALVDPELTLSCPPDLTAACGMDALSQLLEAFVSVKAGPLTDALAGVGLERAGRSLVKAYENGRRDLDARADMALAAFLSGISLAHAGLGVVHGFASSVGARFNIPHGALCGTLLAESMKATMEALRQKNDRKGLEKFAKAGRIFTGKRGPDAASACSRFLDALFDLTEKLRLPRLSAFGVTEAVIPALAAATENKNNPAPLSSVEMAAVLKARL